MTSEEQVELWCNGQSVHNETTGECCPDFSCCKPELSIPLEQRCLFRDSDYKTRLGMLGMFLGAAIALATEGKTKIYIAGEDDSTIQ